MAGDCAGFVELIGRRAAEALSDADAARLATHLDACEDCRASAELLDPAGLEDSPWEELTELQPVDRALYLHRQELPGGGMGRVTVAWERRLGRTVVLKQTRADGGLDRARLERQFEREVRLTARLQHPSIVNVYEAGQFDDGLFYAMARIDGTPLDEEIERRTGLAGRLALLPSLVAVAHAVAYAHGQRIVHRDLKPANVIIGRFGEAILIDWGLALDLDDRSERVRGGGTAAYMPPEQALGEEPDERLDVYALGATLYHVLAGRAPYQDEPDIAAAVLRGPPTPLGELAPGVPHDLAAIVARAMARDPRQRYATAEAMAADLSGFLAGRMISAREWTRLERARRWLRRHRLPVTIAAVAAVLLVVVGAVSVRRVIVERDRADRERARVIVQRARDVVLTDPTAAVAWLRTYPADGPDADEARLVESEALDMGVARHVLGGSERAVQDVTISADGRWIAGAGADGVVHVWNAATGAHRALVGHGAPVARVAFSPVGGALASASIDGVVRRWDVESGEGEALPSVDHAFEVRALVWSPDGARLAAGGDGGTVVAWDRAGARTQTFDIDEDVFALAFSQPDGASLAAAGRGAALWVLDPASGARSSRECARGVMNVAYAPDGRVAAAGRGGVQLWESDTPPRVLAGDEQGVIHGLAFSPDGAVLAWGDEAGMVRLWRGGTATTHVLAGHHAAIRGLTFASRTTLISISADRSARLWNTDSATARTLLGHGDLITAVAVTADGKTAATSSLDHRVRVWGLEPPPGRRLAGQARRAVAVAVDSRRIATGGEDGVVRVWSAAHPGEPVRTIELGIRVRGLAFSPRGGVLAAAAGERVYLIAADAVPMTARELGGDAPDNVIYAMAFFPDDRLVTGSIDGAVRLWTPPTYAPALIARHHDGVWTVAAAADGRHVASAGFARTLFITNVATGVIDERAGHRGSINAVAIDLGATVVATASVDESTRLFPIGGGDARVWDGDRVATSVAVSRDGATVLRGLGDGEVALWQAALGVSRVIARHGSRVSAVALSPDDRYAASSGLDGTVAIVDRRTWRTRVWRTGGTIHSLAWDPASTYVVAAGLEVWMLPVADLGGSDLTTATIVDDEVVTPTAGRRPE